MEKKTAEVSSCKPNHPMNAKPKTPNSPNRLAIILSAHLSAIFMTGLLAKDSTGVGEQVVRFA